jgi:hypothetical protein
MNRWWLIGVKKQHSLGNLLSDGYFRGPVHWYLAFVEQLEQCTTVAELTDDVHFLWFGSFGHTDHGRDVRMWADLHTGHDLPLKFLNEVRICKLKLFDGYLLPSPASLKHF